MPRTYQDSYRMVNGVKVPYTIERHSDGTEIYSSPGAPGIAGYTFKMTPDSVYSDYHNQGAGVPPEEMEITGEDRRDIKQRQQVLNQNAGEKQGWLQYNMPIIYKGIQKARSVLGFENGGMMSYSQYLQQGGSIQDQVAQLVKAAMSGNLEAQQQIQQIQQAAELGDQKAKQIAQMIAEIAQQLQGSEEETPAMRNGGEIQKYQNAAGPLTSRYDAYKLIPKKELLDTSGLEGQLQNRRPEIDRRMIDKKTPELTSTPVWNSYNGIQPEYRNVYTREGGYKEIAKKPSIRPAAVNAEDFLADAKVLEKGGKTPCPCTLKKVGGKIVEVDCNGNIKKK